LVIAVGQKGSLIWTADGKTWQKGNTGVTEDLTRVAIGREGTVAIVVGNKGTVLRSEDSGKTWKAITSGVTKNLRGVAIVRKKGTTGLSALIVGEGPTLLTSADDGKTWKSETLTIKTALNAAAIVDDKQAMIAGEQGVVMALNAGKWVAGTTNIQRPFYGLAMAGAKAIAVGSLGYAFYTTDGGKNWNSTVSRATQCLGLRNGGGICVYNCDPRQGGRDCPSGLNRCAALRLSSTQSINICQAGTAAAGFAKKGDKCNPSGDASDGNRCGPGLACVYNNVDYACVQRCTPGANAKCPSGEQCVYSQTLATNICGKVAKKGESCDVNKGTYCEAEHNCEFDHSTGKSTCQPEKTIPLHGLCPRFGGAPCSKGLICVGGSAYYRWFCTKGCNTTTGAGCDSGWGCLRAGTRGVCIQRCNGPNDKCKVPSLKCSRLTSGGYFCL